MPKEWQKEWDTDADCEGMLCPLPVLRARKLLSSMPLGAVLRVRATDPMAAIDLPHFCTAEGHDLLASDVEGAVATYLIRCGKNTKG